MKEIQNLLSEYRKDIYENDAPMEIYYVDILCAVITVALSRSSWSLLPRYSELDQSLWSDYLKSSKAPRMLWPAQQLIGKKGILSGKSAIVQLPTGVGKTKSIELIIRSSFASNRATTAIIVAPLRALCNEIANDMITAFGDEVLVNQFSDVLEEDFSLDLFLSFKSKILICTPEKLSYIIHHQADFLDEIGLYIFDEGHMFDDGSRGAIYELLISEIRGHISWEDQVILLSAVLSNAEQIQEWLLGESGVLVSDPQIKATPKAIGFVSQTKDIHYYSDDSTYEDFFIPRSIEVVALQKRPREKKQRYFPELSYANDIAIYYANKLCKNGGAAIFANRTSTVLTVINRIIEIKDRGYDLPEIKRNSDSEEMNRLAQLISDYYGEQHPYTIACHLGIAPHYSNLPNGLRLAVEHAFRGKDLRLVVCTSTLAQGVNIPIKYLFMTNFMVARNSMQIRSFQNLMGRTARSGMYTEGSIIVTDPQLFDNRNNRRNGGNYRWKDCIRMFDSTIAVIQLQNELSKKAENLEKAEELICKAAQKGAKLVCLPELFVTGYNLDVFGESLYDMAEGLSGPTITSLRALAKELGIYIVAPIAMQMRTSRPMENSAVMIGDDGEVLGVYSKNHLFGDEPSYFASTGEYPVFETKYGRVGIMICCDNNFPEPARILALNGAELIFMPAAWRVNEEDLWRMLISSHACENNVYIAAANTYCEMDGLYLFGHSKIVDPRGRVMEESEKKGDDVLVQTIDLDQVYEMRAVMPSLKDRHPETYGALMRAKQA